MKTATAKNLVRALIRALEQLAAADAMAEHYDSMFDAGEWSSAYHGPGTCDPVVDRILATLGITREQADAALRFWAKLDRTKFQPWEMPQTKADALRVWLATREDFK